MTGSIITVSKPALNVLRNMASEYNSKYISFSISSGGCNGFKYNIEPSNEVHKLDELVKIDDVTINVCQSSLLYVLGTQIDWKKDFLGERFVFENPTSTGNCGCGSTFSVD